jgi:hypothetical protein
MNAIRLRLLLVVTLLAVRMALYLVVGQLQLHSELEYGFEVPRHRAGGF